MAAAVSVGSANPDVVAVEARKAAHARGASTTVATPLTSADEPSATVPAARHRVDLTERRLVDARNGRTVEVVLPADGRPLTSVAQYGLLAHPPAVRTRGA